jgi:hypothetical protein
MTFSFFEKKGYYDKKTILYNFDNNHSMLALHDIYLHIMWKQLKVFLARLTDNFVHPMLPVSSIE